MKKTASKYNVIFMRDDRPVRRFRFKPVWLRTFLYFQFFLIIIAAAAGYFGYNFWLDNIALQEQNADLNHELQQKVKNLKKLENMQKSFESYEQKVPEDLIASLQKERSNESSASIDLNELFRHVNLERIGVENMQARFIGNRLQLNFEINNLIGNSALSGIIRTSLITRQGKIIEMEIKDSDLDFKIQNFKRIKTSIPVPDDIDKKDVFGIRIIVKNEKENKIFSETYPLAYIIS